MWVKVRGGRGAGARGSPKSLDEPIYDLRSLFIIAFGIKNTPVCSIGKGGWLRSILN